MLKLTIHVSQGTCVVVSCSPKPNQWFVRLDCVSARTSARTPRSVLVAESSCEYRCTSCPIDALSIAGIGTSRTASSFGLKLPSVRWNNILWRTPAHTSSRYALSTVIVSVFVTVMNVVVREPKKEYYKDMTRLIPFTLTHSFISEFFIISLSS